MPNIGLNFYCEGCNKVAAGMLKILTALKSKVDKPEKKVGDIQKNLTLKLDKV